MTSPDGGLTLALAARTDAGRKRDHNEDSCLVCDLDAGAALEQALRGQGPANAAALELDGERRGVFAVVADGMGGASAGEVASRLAIDTATDWIVKHGNAETDTAAETLLHRAIVAANEAVHQASRNRDKLRGMGTTMTAVWIRDGRAHIAQVGDSRAYRLRAGQLERLTQDQTLVGQLVANNQITEEQARGHAQGHVILQALGVKAEVEPVKSTEPLQPGDVLLLCSDGLTAVFDTDADLLEAARGLDPEPEALANGLVELANEGGAPDNVTVVAVRVGGHARADADAASADASADMDTVVDPPAASAPAARTVPRTMRVQREPAGQPRPSRSSRTWIVVAAVVLVVLLLLAGRLLAGERYTERTTADRRTDSQPVARVTGVPR